MCEGFIEHCQSKFADAITEIFGDTYFVVVHRDPVAHFGSFRRLNLTADVGAFVSGCRLCAGSWKCWEPITK